MRYLIILLLFIPNVYSEQWICFDSVTKQVTSKKEGDGTVLGLCGANNSNIHPDCILANKTEYDSFSEYKKYDASVVTGNRIVDMTQDEKDVILAEKAAAAASFETIKFSGVDIKMSAVMLKDFTMPNFDLKIDSITNIDEVKTFLKLLSRYVAKNN